MEKLTIADGLKLVMTSIAVNLLIFLMIEVLFAQIIKDTLLTAVDGQTSLVAIIFLGLLVTLVVSVIVGQLVSGEFNTSKVSAASILALFTTVMILTIVSYLCVIDTYPDIIPEPHTGLFFTDIIARGLYYLISIPQVIAVFAIYFVGDVVLTWIYALAINAGAFSFFLYLLHR